MFKATTILAAVLMAITADAAIIGGNTNINANGEKTRALKTDKSAKSAK